MVSKISRRPRNEGAYPLQKTKRNHPGWEKSGPRVSFAQGRREIWRLKASGAAQPGEATPPLHIFLGAISSPGQSTGHGKFGR